MPVRSMCKIFPKTIFPTSVLCVSESGGETFSAAAATTVCSKLCFR